MGAINRGLRLLPLEAVIPVTSLCPVLSQGFPGVPGSSGPKVSVQMLGEQYGAGGCPEWGHFPTSHSSSQGDRGETGPRGEQVRPPPFSLVPVAIASTHVPTRRTPGWVQQLTSWCPQGLPGERGLRGEPGSLVVSEAWDMVLDCSSHACRGCLRPFHLQPQVLSCMLGPLPCWDSCGLHRREPG